MATFSENQVRHLFVAKSASGATEGALVPLVKDSNLYFNYVGKGGKVRTDLIPLDNIVSVKATKSESMSRPLRRTKITLADDVVSGQDYLLRLTFRQYVGMGDDTTYMSYGAVHGVKNMEADTFYKTMAISLAKNVSRNENKLVKVMVHSGAGAAGKFDSDHFTEVTAKHTVSGGAAGRGNDWDDGSGTKTDIDYILLEEVEQPWVLGKIPAEKIPFEVSADTIRVDGDDVDWATITKVEPDENNSIKNGKEIADLEWFCMGERADLYRGIGWPNNIETKYSVDPEKVYDTIDITYFYAGNGVDVQKSQKVLTIVMEDAEHAIEGAMAKAINAATGKTLVEDFTAIP